MIQDRKFGGALDIGTIITSIVTAFLSTIVLQYLFAPWLEARKAQKLKQAEARAELAGKLTELAGLEWSVKNYVRTGPENYKKALAQLRLQTHELGVLEDYSKIVGELPKYVQDTVTRAWSVQNTLFGDYDATEDEFVDEAVKLTACASKVLNPGTDPWIRLLAASRSKRLAKKIRPQLQAAVDRALTRTV